MNIVMLIGRLVKDPELVMVGQNIPKASFTIAVPARFKRDETYFVDAVAWRKTAETLSQHVKKGDRVAISGALEIRKYTDRDGNERRATEINVDQFAFLDPPKEAEKAPAQAPMSATPPTRHQPPKPTPQTAFPWGQAQPEQQPYPEAFFEDSPAHGDDDVPW